MTQLFWLALVLILASGGPLIFPAAQAGYSSMPALAMRGLLPAVSGLVGLSLLLKTSQRAISKAVVLGGAAGILATLPLEAVRLLGFHYGYMPGNLPRLMGVLLLNRFAEGPSLASDIAGWAYHFWNGASFGILFVVLFGARRRWLAPVYGILIGIGFMLSPVVVSLGVGFFGLEFSRGFPATVLAAHLAFGGTLGLLVRKCLGEQPSLLWTAFSASVASWKRTERCPELKHP